MKVYEILTEAKQQEPAKPRNFVAKNARATTSGAGAHKDKKKAAKQGYEKHKKQPVAEGVDAVVQKILSESRLDDFLPPFRANGLSIDDRRGNSVAQVVGHGSLAKEVADALNQYVSKKGVAENIQSVDDWKAAVLQAYPQYADKIKFKGRGLQINAEIPGVDRSFGVYDLGSESGEVLHETATAGATSAGNIATVTSPHLAIGSARGNKNYTGSPGKSGTKAPSPPKTLQKKKADGTAVNALDMKNNIFGGAPVKR